MTWTVNMVVYHVAISALDLSANKEIADGKREKLNRLANSEANRWT